MPRNIDVCKAGYDAFGAGDLDAVWDLIHEDIEVYVRFLMSERAICGRADYEAYVELLDATYEGFECVDFEYYENAGGRVLTITTVKGRNRETGDQLLSRLGWLWAFKDGRFFRAWEYANLAEARRALGPVAASLRG